MAEVDGGDGIVQGDTEVSILKNYGLSLTKREGMMMTLLIDW